MDCRRLFPFAFCLPLVSFSQAETDELINQKFENATGWYVDAIFAEIPITDGVGVPWVLVVLLLGASYFTFLFQGNKYQGIYYIH